MRPKLRIDNSRGERPKVWLDGKRVYVSAVTISIDVSKPHELSKIIEYDWRRGFTLLRNDARMERVEKFKCNKCGTVWNERQTTRECLCYGAEYGKPCGGKCKKIR